MQQHNARESLPTVQSDLVVSVAVQRTLVLDACEHIAHGVELELRLAERADHANRFLQSKQLARNRSGCHEPLESA